MWHYLFPSPHHHIKNTWWKWHLVLLLLVTHNKHQISTATLYTAISTFYGNVDFFFSNSYLQFWGSDGCDQESEKEMSDYYICSRKYLTLWLDVSRDILHSRRMISVDQPHRKNVMNPVPEDSNYSAFLRIDSVLTS